MTEFRYAEVSRRAVLAGLSLSAVVATSAACSPGGAGTASATGGGVAGGGGNGPTLPATANVVVSWTFTANGRMRRNPYMAVWVEDASGKLVRTLALYHLAEPNDRWLNSLTRWYAVSRAVDTTTSGTKPAGTYSASWDGNTAGGGRGVQGDYHVCVETAVEHGQTSLVRQRVSFAAAPARAELTPKGDITAASVEYTP